MRSQIFNLIKDQTTLSWEQIAANIIVSGILGFLIFISYMISHRGTIYSKKFNVSLVVLTVLTSMVMTVIGNNIALSLGMVGALSIVRFRTAIKDSRDTVYIFWTIIVGICCGVGDFIVAGIGSGFVFIILLIFDSMWTRLFYLVIDSLFTFTPLFALGENLCKFDFISALVITAVNFGFCFLGYYHGLKDTSLAKIINKA